MHSSPDGISRPGASPARQALDALAMWDDSLFSHRGPAAPRRLTLCTISRVINAADGPGRRGALEPDEIYNVLGQGLSVCHPNDTFSKAIGRKKSLAASMRVALSTTKDEPEDVQVQNYQDRTDIWNAFRAEFEGYEMSNKEATRRLSPTKVELDVAQQLAEQAWSALWKASRSDLSTTKAASTKRMIAKHGQSLNKLSR